MQEFEFINENNHVKAGVRNQLKAAVESITKTGFNNANLIKNVNGGYSIPVGIDTTTGQTIWAHIEVKVNLYGPDIDAYTKRKITRPKTIPNLFE